MRKELVAEALMEGAVKLRNSSHGGLSMEFYVNIARPILNDALDKARCMRDQFHKSLECGHAVLDPFESIVAVFTQTLLSEDISKNLARAVLEEV